MQVHVHDTSALLVRQQSEVGSGRAQEVHRWGLRYCDARLPVMPIRPRLKKPYQKGSIKRASANHHQTHRWLAVFPVGNLALVTGHQVEPGKYLFVVDVDGDQGRRSLRKFLDDRGMRSLPKTAMSLTNRGFQCFFTAPFQVKSRPLDKHNYPGIDIKGRGGYVLVEPSIHPSGHHYKWNEGCRPEDGIAEATGEFLTAMPRHPDDDPGANRRVDAGGPDEGPTKPRTTPTVSRRKEGAVRSEGPQARPTGGRTGDPDAIATELNGISPIPGPRTREPIQYAAVLRLVGLGYSDDVIRLAIRAWVEHHIRLGRVASTIDTAMHECEGHLARVRGYSDFRVARICSKAEHRERCRRIRLPEELDQSIRDGTVLDQANTQEKGERGAASVSRGTLIRNLLSERSKVFIEALCVLMIDEIQTGSYDRDGTLVMTDAELVDVATDRHPEIAWDRDDGNKQVRREKDRFVNRPDEGKEAETVALISELVKGRRVRPGLAGTPSVYRPTRLLLLPGMAVLLTPPSTSNSSALCFA